MENESSGGRAFLHSSRSSVKAILQLWTVGIKSLHDQIVKEQLSNAAIG